MKAFEKTGGDMRDNHETRITRLEAVIENINENLKDIKKDLKDVRSDIKELDKKFDSKFESYETKIQSKLDRINNRIWFNFYWGIGGFATVLGLLAHAMKWIP